MITTTIKNILQEYACADYMKNHPKDMIVNLDPWYLVDNYYQQFFSFPMPWYEDNTESKTEFQKLFLHRYFMNEIGQETVNLHKQMLYTKLSIRMPYYKQMFQTMLNEQGVDMTNNLDYSMDGKDSGTAKGDKTRNMSDNTEGTYSDTNKTTTDTNSQSIESDNPQINFAGVDYASAMNRGQSDQTVNGTASGTNSSDKTVKETEDHSESTTGTTERNFLGRQGAFPAEVIEKWRNIVYNINQEIIGDLDSLFLGVRP